MLLFLSLNFLFGLLIRIMIKKFFHKNCMCLQINIGPGPECSLCLDLEGLKTAGIASWESFVSGQWGVNTVLPGKVYQSCAAQPNQLH